MTRCRLTLRHHRPDDRNALLALHHRAFADSPPRTERHWRWLFEENPARAAHMVVAMTDDGRCAGMFGGVVHRAILAGEPCRAILNLDVATDPEVRRGLSGARLLIELGRRHARYYGGECKLVWGFPEPPLMRVSVRYMRFEILRDVLFLVRTAASGPTPPAAVAVRTVTRLDSATDGLWRRCMPEIDTGIVRDAPYLNWRYADHPTVQYRMLEALDARTDALRGVAVVREGGWDRALLSVLDWLVPLEDAEAEAALVARVVAMAAERGTEHVAVWFPPELPAFHRFQVDHGFFVVPTPYRQVFRSFHRGATRAWLVQRWYQTMGDMDFF